jgi:hypothetical protein
MNRKNESLSSSSCKKKQGKRLSDTERSEIISLKRNSQLSDMKIALKYNVDRSTITKIMNKVKKEATSLSQASLGLNEAKVAPVFRRKKKAEPFVVSKEEASSAKKLKLIEESLSNWRESALSGEIAISNDSLKQKALDIFNLLKEKSTPVVSSNLNNFNINNNTNDWYDDDDEDSFDMGNSCDESNFES